MKIGLVSEEFIDGDIKFNCRQIEKRLIECSQKGLDLICFGESFLQGFQGLTWDYAEDLRRAKSQDDEVVVFLKRLARQHEIALSCGYFEKERETIYCSNLVISHQGSILNNYRRLSPGWKEPKAGSNYREGTQFSTFTYKGRRFAAAICGDLWAEANIRAAGQLEIDCLLWPNYLDYSLEKWESGEKEAYARQVQGISGPVLMVNSYVKEDQRAKGGCCVFQNGLILQELPVGNLGVLVYEL